MAYFKYPGKQGRGRVFLDLVVANNQGITAEADGMGMCLWGERIVVKREWLAEAFWPDKTPTPHNLHRKFRGLLSCGSPLVKFTEDEIVFGDRPIADKSMLVRFPEDVKAEIEQYAERTGLSQNAFIVLAVSDFIEFLKEQDEQASRSLGVTLSSLPGKGDNDDPESDS